MSRSIHSPVKVALIVLSTVFLSRDVGALDAPITDCDKLAASNTDQQRVVEGIALPSIKSDLAIPACLDAVNKYPDHARFQFQLGRAYQNAKTFDKAMEFYRRAANLGYSQSVAAVGTLHHEGLGVPKDESKAVEWFRRAAEQGNALAQAFMGQAFKGGRGAQKNVTEAIYWFQLSAKQGNFIGQLELAKCYFEGSGVAQDDVEAANWARKAADQGYAPAQLYFGYLTERGRGTSQSLTEAAKLYRAAAEQGNSVAQNNLGNMYSRGIGVKQSEREALKWYRMAAELGNAKAQFQVGQAYRLGRNVKGDPAEAVKWFRLAAEQGNADGQMGLAWSYRLGKGVIKNSYEEARWLKLAAAQGHAIAQNDLGAMFGRGEAMPQDYGEAVKWFALSAAQGNPVAQTNLAKYYVLGRHVPRDLVFAHMWANLAASRGDDEARRLRDSLVGKMDTSSIDKAQRMARLCQASQFKDCGQAESESSRPSPGDKPDRISAGSTSKSSGTGFFVSPDGYVISNEHVVRSCSKIVATDNNGDRLPLRLVRASTTDDLVLLKADTRRDAFARMRESGRVNQGEAVALYGYPLSRILASTGNVSTGYVTALAGIKDNDRHLQISAPVQPGNSGGPLVDFKGNVVGVVVSKLDAIAVANATDDIPQNVNFAIKASSLLNLLDLSSINYHISPDAPVLNLENLTKKIREFTVLINCY